MIATGSITLCGPDDCRFHCHVSSGFINVTDICKARGKNYSDWRRNDKSQKSIAEIAEQLGLSENEIIITRPTGPPDRRGTWCHPTVASLVAGWADPMFVVWLMDNAINAKSKEENTYPQSGVADCTAKLDDIERVVCLLEKLGGLEDSDRHFYRNRIRKIWHQINEKDEVKHSDQTSSNECEPHSTNTIDNVPVMSVRSIALATALRLGHRPLPIEKRIQESINNHLQQDKRMDRDVTHYRAVDATQVCILLRAQSFRCLICDHIMSLTLTMAEDIRAFSMGRIWNHLPHCFPNLCLVCSGCNKGNSELYALRRMLRRDEISDYADMLNNKSIPFDKIKDMNIVVEALAPSLLKINEDHMKYVFEWVERNESCVDDQMESAFDVLEENGFGKTKREFLDELCEERGTHCKRFKIEHA